MRNVPLAGTRPARPSAPLAASSTPGQDRRPARRLRGWAVLALAAGLAACEAPPTGPALEGSSSASAEQQFVGLVNAHRAAIGCPALAWEQRVADVAARHSRDMAVRAFFSHTNPDGQDPWARLAAAGVRFSTGGENIAWGQSSASEAFRSWMNSAPHRRNIENCALTHHGVGVYEGRWTNLFIRPL
ncbi:MAG TPA: CAP domain-containing protein [Longimicrobiaceae bacterium]|nr:CAP domain-containing protein [Longimicrobiaceae bacterium]